MVANVLGFIGWSIRLAMQKESLIVYAAIQTDSSKEEMQELHGRLQESDKAFRALGPIELAKLIKCLSERGRDPEEIRHMARPIALLQVVHEPPLEQLVEKFDRLLRLYQEPAQNAMSIADATVAAAGPSWGSDPDEIPGDPTRYSLRDDGLTLALGLAVVDKLRTSGRQDRDLDEELAALLEPIVSLDDVADLLLAALTIESGEVARSDLVGVLAYGFGTLQNVTDGAFAEFNGLVASEPAGFMQAAERIALADDHHINLDWFDEALLAASHDKDAWAGIGSVVSRWLSSYTLDAARRIPAHIRRDPEKLAIERTTNENRLAEKLSELSASERCLLKELVEVSGDVSRLTRLVVFSK